MLPQLESLSKVAAALERIPQRFKIVAFEHRGRRDPLMSRDLDDIVTLLVGRQGVVSDVTAAPLEIRALIAQAFHAWRNQPLVWDSMDGCETARNERRRLDEVRRKLASLENASRS